MIIDDQLIIDKDLNKAMSNFIDEYIKSYKWSKDASYNYRKELTTVFTNINLSDINKENILNVLKDKNYTCITIRFLIYLCENNFLGENNSLNILISYKSIFKNNYQKDLFEYFINCDYLDEFFESHKTLDKNEVTILKCNINNIEFNNCKLKDFANKYLKEMKLSTTNTSACLKNRCNTFVNICKNFISLIDIKDITRQKIYEKLSEEWVRTGTFIEINKFIKYLLDNEIVVSDELSYITNLKEQMNNLSLEKYKEILLSTNPKRYFLRPSKKSYCLKLFYTDIDNVEIFNIVKEYTLHSNEIDDTFNVFLGNFNESIKDLKISSIDDFSMQSFKHQIEYYKSFNNSDLFTLLNTFYFYLANNYNPELIKKDGFDSRVLQKTALAHLIADGYELIKYNQIEDVPKVDKWIFCYSSNNETNSMISTSNCKCIDFTVINNKIYRNWYKYYIWKYNASLYTRFHTISRATLFFNYIDDLKKGKELSIYAKKTENENITLNEIIAYKNYIMNTYENNRTRNSHIYTTRTILKFIHEDNLVELPNGVFYYLTHKLDSNYDNTKTIPDEDLKKISEFMKEKAKENVNNAVYYLAFYIALETEFRSSQLFGLKIDCVRETSKKNEYVLVSKTKTSNNEEIEQPITTYVKAHIDEVLKLTQEYRDNNVISDISSYLFIIKGNLKDSYRVMSTPYFNAYLQKCCKELSLPLYSYNNLRDTHMTKAEEFIIRNQMSDMEQGILSGHRSPNTDTKHYIDTQIKDLLESVHGVIIGNVDVGGKIKEELPNDITTKENSVSNNCGYCNCKNCNDFSFLDCILCKDFVTTIDKLPYFEEQVKVIDEKIKNASINHDKEDLVNIKRLYLGFIQKILEIKQKKGEENNDTK